MIDRQSPLQVSVLPNRGDQSWRVLGICFALAALTFAVFGQTLTHEFVNFDDPDYVYDNPIVAAGVTPQGIEWAFTHVHSDNWHPLTWISHELDCQLYGLHPAGHHLTNVLLHIATVIALFLVLRQTTGSLWRGAFVAAVFAIHPLRVESVAWVSERKDVLSGLFFMMTIAAYVCYARRPWSAVRYGLVVVLFAMGLMCKPMLVTLPVILLLLDYWPLRRWGETSFSAEPSEHKLSNRNAIDMGLNRVSPYRVLIEKLPLLGLTAASCVVTLLAQHGAMHARGISSLPYRLGNALVSCIVYLFQMVYPVGLAVIYPLQHNVVSAWKVALEGVVLVRLSMLAWGERRTRPWLLVGWVWYLVMLLPVLGLIQVGLQAHADRYTYLPQIGIYIAVTWLAAECRFSREVLGSLMATVIAILMAFTWHQTTYWHDSETLWNHTLACTVDNDRAENNLATALLHKGKTNEAMVHYQKALQLDPGNVTAELYFANALRQTGDASGAIEHLRSALRLTPSDPQLQNFLAWLLATCPRADLRNGKEALELARQANGLTGGANSTILRTLAAALAETGRFSEAAQTAQQAFHLAESQSNFKLAAQLQAEIKLYQAGTPLHVPVQTKVKN